MDTPVKSELRPAESERVTMQTAPTLETTEARGQFMKWAIDRNIAVEDPQSPGFYTLPKGVRLYPEWLPENEAEVDIEKYRAYLEGVKLDLTRKIDGEVTLSESFTEGDLINALNMFLAQGEGRSTATGAAACAGDGWAARCLRWHRDQLIKKREKHLDN